MRPSTRLLMGMTLPISVALIAALALTSPAEAQQTKETATVAEQYLLAAANQERATRGLPLLRRDSLLARSAAQHAEMMAEHESISHQFAGEAALPRRGASVGLAFSLISENVGQAPSVAEIHEMWMQSEHHRTNLLDPSVDAVGIRVIARNGELYAVEDFARTVRNVSLDEQESTLAGIIARSSMLTLANDPEATTTARKTCTMSSGYSGMRKPWFVMRFTSDSLTELPDQLKQRLSSGRYREASVGACASNSAGPFTSYNFAVLLYP